MEYFSIKPLSEKVKKGNAAIRETDPECKEARDEKMWIIILPTLPRKININIKAQSF